MNKLLKILKWKFVNMSYRISDRYIPLRLDDTTSSDLVNSNIEIDKKKRKRDSYETGLFNRVFELEESPRILHYRTPTKKIIPLTIYKDSEKTTLKKRSLPPICKTLDAHNIANDFYYHSLSGKNDLIGIILDNMIALTDFKKTWTYNELDNLRCIHLSPYSNELYCGRSTIDTQKGGGIVSRYNLELQRLTSMSIENDLPAVLHQNNENCICVGTTNGDIYHVDMRIPCTNYSSPTSTDIENAHKDTICNLSYNDPYLASGGCDNYVRLWDVRKQKSPLSTFEFSGSVRALDWNNRYLLAGGGKTDRTVNILDIHQNKVLDFFDSGSQVINLHASTTKSNEFVTTHGLGNTDDLNSLIKLWKISPDNEITLLDETKPETGRSVHSCLINLDNSPTLIASRSLEEVLNVWKGIFEQKPIPLLPLRENRLQFDIR